jgi:hypothetical protein
MDTIYHGWVMDCGGQEGLTWLIGNQGEDLEDSTTRGVSA